MKWGFTLPGQPPSWNTAYRIITKHGRRGGYQALGKTSEAKRYQIGAANIIRSAKPSRWKPIGQLRIHYWLYLARDMDCDNVLKLINDVIQTATGVDDKWFLPTVEEKTTGWGKKARVEVVIEDHESPYAGRPASSTTPTPSSSSSAVSPPTPSSASGPQRSETQASSSR